MPINVPVYGEMITVGTITYTEQSASSISDLTGTKWVLNENPDVLTVLSPHYWSINFTSNSSNFDTIGINYDDNVLRYQVQNPWLSINVYEYYGLGDKWVSQAYRTIEITGGTDATNADLIAWLQANATQQTPVASTTYELTHSLTNLTHGNVSFTVTPDSGHSLPSSVTVTNGTLVSYDSSTGVIVVSGDGAEISVTCEQASVSHTVTLTIANESSLSDKTYIRIYDGQDETGTLLSQSMGSVFTPTPQTLTCTSGYLCIVVSGGATVQGDFTTSGDVTSDRSALSDNTPTVFTVTGDGEIYVSDLDWDF